MESKGATWTALAALVISLVSGAITVFSAMRGPQVQALPIENVILFAHPDDGKLAAIALPEIANTASEYPDILESQAIFVWPSEASEPAADAKPAACLSARGGVRLHMFPEGAPRPEINKTSAAETIELTGSTLEVLDVSSRAPVPAGHLLSQRQLFDQVASSNIVDPCHESDHDYTASEFIEAFQGKNVVLRYVAEFAHDNGYAVECGFELNERRVERLRGRGWINAPCASSSAGELSDHNSWWENAKETWDRLF